MKQFMSFLLVGSINTVFAYLVFCAAAFLGGSASLSLIITYICGIIFSFFTTGHFVFGQTEKDKIVKFIGLYICIFFINKIALEQIDQIFNSYYLSQGILAPFMAIFSFISLKFLVFKNEIKGEKSKS